MSFLIIWLIGSEWHCIVSLPGSLRSTSHPTTNSKWVSLLYFFARQFHQLLCLIIWLIGSEFRHCCIPLPCIISHHMTNREWVTLHYFFAGQSDPHHVSSHDQQQVSDTALFPSQAISSLMSHPMTNSMWVTLLYFFAHYLTISWSQVVSRIPSNFMASHPVMNSQWVIWHLCQSLLLISQTASEWGCIHFSLEHITWSPITTNRRCVISTTTDGHLTLHLTAWATGSE